MKAILSLFLILVFSQIHAEQSVAETQEMKTPVWNAEQAKVIKYFETVFTASKEVNNADSAKKKKSRSDIEAVMDWDRVKVDCLGKENLKKRSAAEANEFRDVLKDVIVRTAYTRLDKFWEGLSYQFTSIDIKPGGKEAFVKAIFTVKKNDKSEDFSLDYYLNKKGADWKIYDIAYEDLRYSAIISEQIIAFLDVKSFKELMGKLKKKRAEL